MQKLKRKIAKIVLEDGITFSGFSFGAAGIAFGEVVFNTSLTGYQEILTVPNIITTIQGAQAAINGMESVKESEPIQEYLQKRC